MRFLLVILIAVTAGATWAAGPAPAASPSSSPGFTNTIITCLNGTTWHPTNAIFRGSVRVFDPQLYLECEYLEVYYPSNNTPSPNGAPGAGGVSAARAEGTPNIGNITSIVAHTNVLMMMRGATIIGDRAIYWATNDLIRITGEIVVIETENGYAYGNSFLFDRRTSELTGEGPNTLESKAGTSLLTTNSAAPPGPRPRNPTNNAPPRRTQ